ncbi:hypothetical protein Sjap_004125 [Stephania japonica]|uniref:G domain-containing protein n=1 Tax=Stephania japonica TaxID=461633 RepID=A0AAP0K1Q4_9MAGN
MPMAQSALAAAFSCRAPTPTSLASTRTQPPLPWMNPPRLINSSLIWKNLEMGSKGISKKWKKSEGEGEGGVKNEDEWWGMEELGDEFEEIEKDEILNRELEGFAPAGIGYGNVTEEYLNKVKRERVSKAERKAKAREAAAAAKRGSKEGETSITVCARCHSLRHYGQVKNHNAENLIPDFDFDRLIAARLMKPTGNADSSVVLRLPKLVLVATKVDLLPSQISPTRLDRWVRNRAKANGAPKLSGVYLVSARKDLGVRNLLSFIKELAGPRGNVWVIGAQNAGKSTLINVFAKKEGSKISKLTEAAVPGTTLGILRIGGILPAKAKMYDTPGLLHPYLMSMRLNRDEQKMAEIRKELQPRTYRIKASWQSIHVGALVRLDLNQASVETIYVTVWASSNISLHLGKVENADEIWKKHAGIRLQPPIGSDRVPELGELEQKEYKVSGITWDVNGVDIAIAGLGWFSVCLKGEATLALWTLDGIEITVREPLALDRAPFLERPGFLLPKAISDAVGSQTKLEAEKRKKEAQDSLSEVAA